MSTRTSHTQFLLMVEFMEKNGDLSKPSGGPRGRQWCNERWKELTAILNSEGEGKTASEEKWRKAWSDFKNNTKRKWAKVKRSVQGTGGGPALKMSMTDLEQRVLAIMGEEAATGLPSVHEIGFGEVATEAAASAHGDTATVAITDAHVIGDEEWNVPSTSFSGQQPAYYSPTPPPLPVSPRASTPIRSLTPPTPPPRHRTPSRTPPRPTTTRANQSQRTQRQKRKKQMTSLEEIFVRMENNAREDNRERDRVQVELERERIRLKEIELQIRRDELELKAQFLEFLREGLRILERYLNEKK